jgi:hypothetical protein
MPALFTLQLPLSVRDGQKFRGDVQQHSGLTFRTILPDGRTIESRRSGQREFTLSARNVLGAFRITVAVKLGEPLLQKLLRNLAALRYIFQVIPKTDSWHPVFVRYIGQLGDQIQGLGIDPDLIPPSADDPGIPGRPDEGDHDCYTGKVSEVIFNCFGDFEGFALETCGKCHHFRTTEKGVRDLVLRACRERLLISVCIAEGRMDRIREIIVRSGQLC